VIDLMEYCQKYDVEGNMLGYLRCKGKMLLDVECHEVTLMAKLLIISVM
jgi:hypothetical protein